MGVCHCFRLEDAIHWVPPATIESSAGWRRLRDIGPPRMDAASGHCSELWNVEPDGEVVTNCYLRIFYRNTDGPESHSRRADLGDKRDRGFAVARFGHEVDRHPLYHNGWQWRPFRKWFVASPKPFEIDDGRSPMRHPRE
jgi:hypothetical protein